MAEQERRQRSTESRSDEVSEEPPAKSESGEKVKAELDDLLDEIDEVLETNAEDFVRSYVQKGGE
jgi:ubiquitin-like protein Pup